MKSFFTKSAFGFTAALMAAVNLWGTSFANQPDHPVKAVLISEVSAFAADQAFTVGLELKHEKNWHTYWKDPGDAGLPTEIEWNLPKGVTASAIMWPQPDIFKDPSGFKGYGYHDTALLLVEIKAGSAFRGDRLDLTGSAFWLTCFDVCIPGETDINLTLSRGVPAAGPQAARFAAVRPTLGQNPVAYGRAPYDGTPLQGSLLWMLALAFLGGLLLNLMPCVLPVLSIKVMDLVEQSHLSRAEAVRSSLWYTLGIVVSFWALSAAVIALKTGGEAVGWGFQFQEPAFVVGMAVLVLAFALNLFGVFEITLAGSAAVKMSQQSGKSGAVGAVSHGMFITALATPCSAPFLGTAMGFAFTQPAYGLVAAFSAAGLGLAAPFILIAALPKARAWLPRPGAWMERFKQGMGFLLLATLVWLMWVLDKQIGPDSTMRVWAWLLVWAMGLWWMGWVASQVAPSARKWAVRFLLVIIFAISGDMLVGENLEIHQGPSNVKEGWISFDAAEVHRLAAEGKTVFVDFTADWCFTCKANEKLVLSRKSVKDLLAKNNVVMVMADWTRRDPAIEAVLRSFGRAGVPMYVIYPGGDPANPILLPEGITPGIVIEALEKAGPSL